MSPPTDVTAAETGSAWRGHFSGMRKCPEDGAGQRSGDSWGGDAHTGSCGEGSAASPWGAGCQAGDVEYDGLTRVADCKKFDIVVCCMFVC